MTKLKHLRIIFAGIAFIVSQPLFANQGQDATSSVEIKETIYSKILSQHIQTLPAEVASSPEKTTSAAQEKLKQIIPPLSPRAQTILAFELLNKTEQSRDNNDYLSSNLWKDLNLFCGESKPEESILNAIKRTETQTGLACLARMMTEPSNDIAKLLYRQSIIKELVENEELFNQLDTNVRQFARGEEAFLANWKPLSEDSANLVKNFYAQIPINSINNLLNTSPKALSLLHRSGQVLKGISFATTALALPALVYKLIENHNHPINKVAILAGLSAQAGSALILNTIFNNESINQMFFLQLLENLVKVRGCIRAMENGIKTFRSNPILKSKIQELGPIYNLTHHSDRISPEIDELIKLFQSSTFNSKKIFSSPGTILVAYKLLGESKDLLLDAYKAFGFADAYLSVAKLYKEHKDKKARYCFPVYDQSNTPHIALINGWSPLLNPDTVVTNNFSIGTSDHDGKNAIITGPNAGGKSTIIKSIALGILLAQTIGIAPGEHCNLTPFRKINTYLNITDDLAAGNSLFKAEVLRAHELIKTIESLKKDEFCLTFADEIFSGTQPVEGEAAAYSMAKYLSRFQNSITIVATHFSLLTNLEKVTKKNYINKKVSVQKNGHGILLYPYKLEDGISNQNIALDLLEQEGFDSSITTHAHAIVENYNHTQNK